MQTGLLNLSDTVVGGATGPGLSGGQKKRLVVALQLLNLPSIIFLDEPTSGESAERKREGGACVLNLMLPYIQVLMLLPPLRS